MNVLHAIHDFLPRHQAGSEIYAFELCRAQSARHHVTLLCAEYDPARAHGLVVWRMHEGLPVVEIVNNWQGGTFESTYRSPRMGEQIEHLLGAIQPDVLHVHNLLNLTFDLPSLARARGIPVVATLHDYTLVCPSGGQRVHRAEAHVCRTIDTTRCARCFPQSPFQGQRAFGAMSRDGRRQGALYRAAVGVRKRAPWLFSQVARAVQRGAVPSLTESDIAARLAAAKRVFDDVDLFVAPSQSMADEFTRLGVPASKMRVSDYGFAPLDTLGATPPRDSRAPLRIGYAGTLVWHKGVHVLLDAVRRLPAGSFDVALFGSVDVFPDYVASLRAQARDLPVRFMGGFRREDAADVYARMDVLVVPSLWLENSPLVIHEAFMAGVPVVGARMGGIAELVTDGVNGLTYDASSPGDLADALRRLIDRPDRLDEFRRALPAVKTIDQDVREWESVYSDVVAKRPPGRTA